MNFKHLGLFEGIGGFSLAAAKVGWKTTAWSEINEHCRQVLSYWFENADRLGDIKTTDFKKYANRIDILTGGFPCQPFSVAGEQKGTEDERHLWPEMFRAIREIQPRWIVAENVPGIINWSKGLVFEQVQTDLESEGYEVQSFVLPAAGVNAPHRRDRVWFVAFKNTNGNGWSAELRQKESGKRKQRNVRSGNNERIQANNGETGIAINSNNKGTSSGFGEVQKEDGEISEWNDNAKFSNSSNGIIANAENIGQKQSGITRTRRSGFENSNCDSMQSATNTNGKRQSVKKHRETESRFFAKESISNYWENFPTQSPICSGDDGVPEGLVDITFSKWRNESIKALGNAIVHQVALEIFQTIIEFEKKVCHN